MKQPAEFQKFFDHTLLKPDASREEILKLCRDAAEYDFASVCVNGCHVKFAADKLKDTSVKVAAVTGFPLGAMSTKVKSFETKNALENGASEIDTVINIGALKDGRYDYIQQELIILSTLCHRNRAVLKVILETGLLTERDPHRLHSGRTLRSGLCQNLYRFQRSGSNGRGCQADEARHRTCHEDQGLRRYPHAGRRPRHDRSRSRPPGLERLRIDHERIPAGERCPCRKS